MGDIENIVCHTGEGKSSGALKEHLLKPTLRLPHRTNARKLDAPVRGTHRGTFSRLGIRVTAVGERRAFEALGKGQTGDSTTLRAYRPPRHGRRRSRRQRQVARL